MTLYTISTDITDFSGGGNGENTTTTTSVKTDLADRQGEGTVLPTDNEQGEGVGEEGGSAADEGQTDSSGSVETGVDGKGKSQSQFIWSYSIGIS